MCASLRRKRIRASLRMKSELLRRTNELLERNCSQEAGMMRAQTSRAHRRALAHPAILGTTEGEGTGRP